MDYVKGIAIRAIAEFSTVNIAARRQLGVLRENICQPIIQEK